jgi:hypothetical protein
MGIGPITIFDKSALEMLSVDEACWLETHYLANITPLFFVEVLADLQKQVARGRTPEHVVGNLAEKTPPGASPNVHHARLCQAELLGDFTVIMDRLIILDHGRRVETQNQNGVFFDVAPEMMALTRWQSGDFLEVERQFATAWRRMLSGLNLDEVYKQYRCKLRTFEAVKQEAMRLVDRDGWRYANLKLALRNLGINDQTARAIIDRWKSMGGPPLRIFAPYTAHVLTVDLFFNIGIGADLISRDRPSNKIDIAYLYYLPFCMVFISNDNLHQKTVPCFLEPDQVFVRGADFKADLGKLNEHYSNLPSEVTERGVMSFADQPPHSGFLVTELWDRLMRKDWRDKERDIPRNSERDEKLVKHVKSIAEAGRRQAPDQSPPDEDVDFMVLERSIPIRMGRWRLLPPEVENNQHSP